jgi:hypothetical protein
MGTCMGSYRRVFGDVRPRSVTLEHISAFREKVERDVSRREAHRVIKIWRALWLGAEIAPGGPIFRNRAGTPYSKNKLGDDFRAVRIRIFGPEEKRTLADFRRSGTVEAKRGGATAEVIGTKLANDFALSSNLRKTYAPVDLATVRLADAARRKGRNKNG